MNYLLLTAKPSFTIPLHDQFLAEGEDLLWECEAFGIPDVNYHWLRNSEELRIENMSVEDQDRYKITVSRVFIKCINLGKILLVLCIYHLSMIDRHKLWVVLIYTRSLIILFNAKEEYCILLQRASVGDVPIMYESCSFVTLLKHNVSLLLLNFSWRMIWMYIDR